ncbi:Rmf/CrpP fold protein [Streptomyces sp. NPDC096142]|uniref:Rmf/CrpP fold protein n=1 Tax=Streptomyces sp. NPDC096142 TaxID=3366077 RepID=UPI003802B54E
MGEREALLQALGEGAAAGRSSASVTSCPYPAGDLRRSAWVRGYAKTRELADVD